MTEAEAAYIAGLFDGKGTITWEDGAKYNGQFKDNYRHGKGTIIWPDGEKYIGQWKYDFQNGQGTIILSDGEKRVGKFKDNSMQGRGIITFLKGHTREGDKSLVIMKDNQVIKYKHVLPKLKKMNHHINGLIFSTNLTT